MGDIASYGVAAAPRGGLELHVPGDLSNHHEIFALPDQRTYF
jgi:hypothetical protein